MHAVQPVWQVAKERPALFFGVLSEAQVDDRHGDMLRIEPRIRRDDAIQAAQQKTRPTQKNKRKRHLRNHEG
jgi:hypothetical protein